jgi:hypothetical protein
MTKQSPGPQFVQHRDYALNRSVPATLNRHGLQVTGPTLTASIHHTRPARPYPSCQRRCPWLASRYPSRFPGSITRRLCVARRADSDTGTQQARLAAHAPAAAALDPGGISTDHANPAAIPARRNARGHHERRARAVELRCRRKIKLQARGGWGLRQHHPSPSPPA